MRVRLICLILLLISFVSVEVFTARPSQPIQRNIELPVPCSKEFLHWLSLPSHELEKNFELPITKGQWTQEGLKTEPGINILKLVTKNPTQLSLGPDWWDISTAIPRREGPRYQFQSPQVESINNFPKGWKVVAERLKTEKPSTKPFGAGRILFEKKFCDDKSFSLLITMVESPDGEIITSSSGTPGAPRLRYSLLVRAGENLTAIDSKGMQ